MTSTEQPTPMDQAFGHIRRVLDQYTFRPSSENEMQRQVELVLRVHGHALVTREVLSPSGRFDLLYEGPPIGIRVVLELKHRGARVAAVEQQTQRYAMTHGVHGVIVITTSRRLEDQLRGLTELGGKPFRAYALRYL